MCWRLSDCIEKEENFVEDPIDISVFPYARADGVVVSWKSTQTGIIPSMVGRIAPFIFIVNFYKLDMVIEASN